MPLAVRQKIFIRKTQKGLMRTAREHYLRSDIACGLGSCKTCHQNSEQPQLLESSPILLLDTNVVLHQIDVLFHDAVSNVVILQTVLEEVRHRDLVCYRRLLELVTKREKRFYVFSNEHFAPTYIDRRTGESPNDRNDRAIRTAAAWYIAHASSSSVVLVTDDKANRELAHAASVKAVTVHHLVKTLAKGHPDIFDIYVPPAGRDPGEALFAAHLPLDQLKTGLAAGRLLQGVLHMSSSNYLEGTVALGGVELLVQGSQDLNRAFDSDLVAVQELPPGEWKKPSTLMRLREEERALAGRRAGRAVEDEEAAAEASNEAPVRTARVVGILQRRWKQYPGVLRERPGDERSALFLPQDRRLPAIQVQSRQLAALRGCIIVVGLDRWERSSRHPRGHYVRTIGAADDREAQTAALLLQYGVPHGPFSPAALACLPRPDWSAPPPAPWRRDLRHLPICSVDPPGCTDIDDALHMVELPGGTYQAGVHIADVSDFVRPDSALDREAAERGTTVYFTDR